MALSDEPTECQQPGFGSGPDYTFWSATFNAIADHFRGLRRGAARFRIPFVERYAAPGVAARELLAPPRFVESSSWESYERVKERYRKDLLDLSAQREWFGKISE
ncbi:hypothetical protein LTR10_015743 [Elasticomyces elasticus]|nr:hypothetical protein LTR10_015743 [Elasticomyces elasticus]KAK4975428.1 hypothetical protein LTR42_004638 [Elasticomyces elasticus]